MRITNEERQAISNVMQKVDAESIIYLFGSRVNDEALGGDIDLLVLSKKINLMDKLDILAQLHQRIDERKIDIAIYPDTTSPFPKMFIQTGVQL